MSSPSTPPGEARSGARATQGELGRAMVGLDQGWTMGGELLAGILVLGGLGWLADRALGSTPWLFAIGSLAGFAAGLYLVWIRSATDDEGPQHGVFARTGSGADER